MRWKGSVSAVVLLAIAVAPAMCGPIADLFKKSPKPKTEDRVPQLIMMVKTDLDEHKRSSAAQELRQFDPAQFAELIPTLIDVARNDSAPGVRAEAVQTLAKFRPISLDIGQTLELAEKDPSMRVKIQARTSLVQYYLSGYRGLKKSEPPALQSGEPPLAVGDHHQPGAQPTQPSTPPKLVPVGGTSSGSGEKATIIPSWRPSSTPSPMPSPMPSPVSPMPSSPLPSAPMPSKPPAGSGSSCDPFEPPQLDIPK